MRLSLSRERARVRLLQSAVARSKSTASRWLDLSKIWSTCCLSREVRASEVVHVGLASISFRCCERVNRSEGIG
jgi:hypothetical protein